MGYYKNTQSSGARNRQPVTVEFDGTENLMEIFEKMPEQYSRKLVQQTFKKAAKVFTTELKQRIPSAIRKLSGAVNIKAGKGYSVTAGISAKKGYATLKDKRTYDVYFPLYWFNYGTYEKRDPGHAFRFARKPKTRNWNKGIKASLFVETSWTNTRQRVEAEIEKDIETRTNKFLDKHTIK
jgi:hypothetical protein